MKQSKVKKSKHKAIYKGMPYLVLIRYWAKFIDSGVPDMATDLSLDPSSEFEIFIVAPDNCLIKSMGGENKLITIN